MFTLNGQTVVFLGLATLAILSYCIYFDYKRLKEPEYRKRIHQRRQNLNKKSRKLTAKPPLKAEVVEYFLRHVYLGEICVLGEDWDGAVHYFANAIMVCADPHILLCELKAAVPIQLYEKIIAKVRLLANKSEESSSISDLSASSQEQTELSTSWLWSS